MAMPSKSPINVPPPQGSYAPTVPHPPVKPEISSTSTTGVTNPRPPPPPPSSDADVIHVPSYSRWFSWNATHECEVRFLPEFFDSRSPSKNPRVYRYYRNSIIKLFRENPARKLTFTEARKTLVGDVGSIRRIFDFLEAWGLINYSPSALNKPLRWEEKETKGQSSGAAGDVGVASFDSSSQVNRESTKRLCSGCKSVCSIACFACDKYDLTLCARCYVRGNYRVGVNSSDFRRVEISEETKADWTEKDTLLLLEAVVHFGDDWRRVAHHVGGRSEKDCVNHFIKLPFGEEFSGYLDSGKMDNKCHQMKDQRTAESGLESIGVSSPSKRMRLTPLADASNPIMAQAAFLSALAGVEVAEAAARAALTAASGTDSKTGVGVPGILARNTRQQADIASNGDTSPTTMGGASVEAKSMLEKEEQDLERAISGIVEVEMKEIQDKIVRFEELDLQMEKERQQLEQMKNQLFADKLSLLFPTSSSPNAGEVLVDSLRTD
ncbi:SWI/SNF complex subunit SWI3B isoform X2 [Tripterygium wilfordii]|uniref:SWI/SNF complex subunit SWI3B isoform X2 n=1 Tax=Tripterygium wilfordii TaxID=458696 RepID=UPI0018F864C9|nr:SWI/SNF complex subunit SWI3B isoform X2 [Tripterygium wilfordii]